MTERLPLVISSVGGVEELQAGDNLPAEDLSTTLAAGNTTGGSNLVISSGDIITSPASTGMIAQAGVGVGAGGGGSATWQSGSGGPTGSGGAAALISGSGGVTSGDGGLVQIMAGAGTGAANIGGTISATAGSGGAVAAGGPIELSGGSTTAASQMAGPATLQSGTSTNGSPAGVTVRSRAGGSGFDGADVTIEASSVPAGNGDGGDVNISAGAGSGTGVAGHVIVTSTLNAELDLLFDESAPPTTLASQGSVFVGDGTGGTTANGLYYRAESDGALTRLDVAGGGESLAATLAIGNTTGGTNIVVSSGDQIEAPDDTGLTVTAGDGTLALAGAVFSATGGDGGPSGAAGGQASVAGGVGTGAGAGGAAGTAGGAGGPTSGTGGTASITGGAGGAPNGVGGLGGVLGGTGSGSGNGGALIVAGGTGGPTGDGGGVLVSSGNTGGGVGAASGDISLKSGTSTAGPAGEIIIAVGVSAAGFAGADVNIAAGGAASGNTDGGSVILTAQPGAGTGTDGQVVSSGQHKMENDIQLDEIAPPSTPASVGSVFVGDGTGGTVANGLYYRAESDGALTRLDVTGGAAALSAVLAVGNTTGGTDISITAGDVVLSGESAPPSTAANQGAVFVGDGTGGTVANGLYYRAESSGALTRLDVTGGGGGDFIYASLSVDYTTPVLNDPIPWDTTEGNQGLTLASNIFSGFTAGKKYVLSSNIRLINAPGSGNFIVAQWYDLTAAAVIGQLNTVRPLNASSNSGNMPITRAYYEPSVTSTVELRIIALNGTPDVQSASASAYIQEVLVQSSTGLASIYASMSANQLNLNVNDPIDLDTDEASRVLTVDSAGKFSGFLAGKTYVMEATMRMEFTSSGQSINLRWWDVTAAAFFGEFAVIRPVVASGGNFSSQDNARAVFSPSVNSEVELRVETVSAAGVIDVTSVTASAYIREF